MVSTFEAIVHRDARSTGQICTTLRSFLNDGQSLHQMRKTSQTLKEFVDGGLGMLLHTLYIRAPGRPGDRINSLNTISAHCLHLIVQIGKQPRKDQSSLSVFSNLKQRWTDRRLSTRPVTAKLTAQTTNASHVDRQLRTHLFRQFKQFHSLTLRIHGNPTWPSAEGVGQTLLTLRLSLEAAEVSTLRTLTVSPIHGGDILHLRWSSFGAFDLPPSPQVSRKLWLNVTTLNLQIRNPNHAAELSYAQAAMSMKILQDHLRSFSRTLRCLKFIWLDGDGPSPLLLDAKPGMGAQEALFWPVLEEFWVGNVTALNGTVSVILERAPILRIMKVLRNSWKDEELVSFHQHQQIWVDVESEAVVAKRGGNGHEGE